MTRQIPRVYICIIDKHVDQGRFEKAARESKGEVFDWWNINKSARPGDLVIFYKLDPDQAFVGTGVVATETRRVTDEASPFRGQPCADIRRARKLPRPIARAEVQEALPDWGFPRRPCKQVLKGEFVEPLMRLLGATNLLSLPAIQSDWHSVIAAAGSFHGGESPQHQAMKEFVASRPEIVGLSASTPAGEIECPLPSGDSLDVSFAQQNRWIAAEVKSLLSNEADIVCGLFQCVKYLAVMEAVLVSENRPQNARVCLVLEGALPRSLIPLKNLLRVEVIEHVSPKGGCTK
jgi:hypothetical protein